MLEKGEQRQRGILVDGRAEVGDAFGEDHMNRGVAEHGHPQQRESGGYQQYAHHKFADGAATGNARDEQPDEGRPRQPPAPVKQGPAADPVSGLVGVQIQRAADDFGQVTAGVLDEGLQDQHGRPEHNHHQQQQHRQGRD